MMYRRASLAAGRRALLVLCAAAIVIAIGLVVFQNPDRPPRWLWRLEVERSLS